MITTKKDGRQAERMIRQEGLDFLTENYWQNSREWFQAHKEDYRRKVVEPAAAFVTALTPFMKSVDPLIVCEPKVDRTISRIYRDLRYARYDTLYRNEVWVSFRRDHKEFPLYPQFYVYVTPVEYGYGCGYYIASPEVMREIRSLILKRSPKFTRMLTSFSKQNIFTLQGEAYKKDRFPEESAKYKDWLNRKCLFAEYVSKDFDKLFSPDFPERVIRDFEKITPLYSFLLYAEEEKQI